MTRSVATWIGIGAICLAILMVPIWNGAISAAEDSAPAWITFVEMDPPGRVAAGPTGDKDCIGDFTSEKQAQRFFIEHGGPKKDPHRLDRDGNGRACEEFDY